MLGSINKSQTQYMANVHGQNARELVQVGEKTLPDTLLDSRIIWVEFISAKGCNVDVPISASISSLYGQWRKTGTSKRDSSVLL